MHAIDWNLFLAITKLEYSLATLLQTCYSSIKNNFAIQEILEKGEIAISQQEEQKASLSIKEGCFLVENRYKPLFPLVFFAYVLPTSLTLFENKKVPYQIVLDTFSDVGIWTNRYARTHEGSFGFDRYYWVMNHFCAHLFKIGRLQYEIGTFESPYTLYRSASDHSLICLAEKGLPVNDSGHISKTNGDCKKSWETVWCMHEDKLFANRVDLDTGTIGKQPLPWETKDLHTLVQKGSPILNVHIPEGSPLTPAAVTESLEQARTFFSPRGIAFDAFICDSWLLDPNLSRFLPEEGNICSFMRRFSKFPVLHEQPQILERVLGPLALKTGSNLQDLLAGYLEKGGTVYTTGGFLTEGFFIQ